VGTAGSGKITIWTENPKHELDFIEDTKATVSIFYGGTNGGKMAKRITKQVTSLKMIILL